MSPETPPLIDNFPPNTLLATLEELLPKTTSWDIATGTFDIGSLLALGELWQPIKPVRIIMGDETTRRTRKELLNATSQQADDGIEIAREKGLVSDRLSIVDSTDVKAKVDTFKIKDNPRCLTR